MYRCRPNCGGETGGGVHTHSHTQTHALSSWIQAPGTHNSPFKGEFQHFWDVALI